MRENALAVGFVGFTQFLRWRGRSMESFGIAREARGENKGPLKYRADIDGLRAIAVLSVILFHVAPNRVEAGGIGVDIFLVISGFLIGGIIFEKYEAGTFSTVDFYMRRLRRIFPAFIVMIFVSSLAFVLVAYPKQLNLMGLSALYAIFCVSNFYFNSTTGYFSDEHVSAPFLHTWTLGVEEQFYFAFPLVFAMIWKFFPRNRIAYALFAIGVLSLLVSQYQVDVKSPAAFYLLPSRSWELLIGVATNFLPPKIFQTSLLRFFASGIGILLIAISLVVLQPRFGFPGWRGLPPTVGTALILASGRVNPSIVHRFLSIKPLQLVGLVSYSLYLWHWPVIVLTMMYFVTDRLNMQLATFAVLLSSLLGFVSWRYIEKPFRGDKINSKSVLWICGSAAATTAACELLIVLSGGLPSRFSTKIVNLAQFDNSGRKFTMPAAKCFLNVTDQIKDFDSAHCLTPKPGVKNVILIGDSHAAMLFEGLRKTLTNANILTAVGFGCEIRIDGADDGTMCGALMHYVFQEYLPSAKIDAVIITSRWTTVDASSLIALGASLKQHGIRLIVLGPVPEYSASVSRLLAESIRRSDPELPYNRLMPGLWEIDAKLKRASGRGNFQYISAMKTMCSKSKCRLSDARNVPLYFDNSHLTDEGAQNLIQTIIARSDPQELATWHAIGL